MNTDQTMPPNEPAPAWLPDWRNAAAYPSHGDDAAAWGWEFLRRNSEYRNDYKRFNALPDAEEDDQGRSNFTPKLKGCGNLDEMIYFHLSQSEPAAKQKETWDEYSQRTGIEPPLLREFLAAKWGLQHLTDPDSDGYVFASSEGIPPYFLSQCTPLMPGMGFLEEGNGGTQYWDPRELIHATWPEEDDDHMVVVALDKRMPLLSQFEVIRQQIKYEENDHMAWVQRDRVAYGYEGLEDIGVKLTQLPRPQFDKFPNYLRVFDAIWLEGWNRKEIAGVVFPKKGRSLSEDTSALRSVDDARKAAFKYIQTGWRDLMKWNNYPKNTNKAGKK